MWRIADKVVYNTANDQAVKFGWSVVLHTDG